MRPTARVFGAALLSVVLVFYAATSELPWLFLLALQVVALILAAFLYAAWNRRGVVLGLAVRESRPAAESPAHDLPDSVLRLGPRATPLFEGDGMGLEIRLRSLRGRRGPVWATGEVSGQKFAAGAGVVTTEGVSRLEWTRKARRGAVLSGGWSVHTSDPLGFFSGLRRLPEAELAVVLPRFASLAGRWEPRELETSVAAPRAGAGNELFGVREYRPGDSLRRIHWRSSARHGELVVREYEPPGVRTVRILLDPAPHSVEVADQVARIAASEAWDCLREGGRVVLSGDCETRDIWEALEWLARYPEAPVDGPLSPDVVVTADPRLLEPNARRNWLVGDAPVETDIAHERVGTTWPL